MFPKVKNPRNSTNLFIVPGGSGLGVDTELFFSHSPSEGKGFCFQVSQRLILYRR